MKIDIEAVESNGDCSRPVPEYILCEAKKKEVVDYFWNKIQSLFPVVDTEGIKNNRRNRTVYTVFTYKIDEPENPEYYQEHDLARYTKLRKAKQLMREVINSLKGGEEYV